MLNAITAVTVVAVGRFCLLSWLIPAMYEAPGKLRRTPTRNVSRAEPLLSLRLQRGGGLVLASSRLRALRARRLWSRPVPTMNAVSRMGPPSTRSRIGSMVSWRCWRRWIRRG